jgi:ABC-type transport system involved in multi-copper enzyme maturation permease subunit
MLGDVRAILWKEWRERMREPGRPVSAWQATLGVLLIGGVYVSIRDPEFMASWGPFVCGVTGAMMVLMGVADTFAGERERRTLEALFSTPLSESGILVGKVLAATTYGWSCSLLLLGAVAATLIARGVEMGVMWEPLPLVTAIVLTLPFISLLASLGALVSLRCATVAQAQQLLFAIVVVSGLAASLVLFGPVLLFDGGDKAPPEWIVRFLDLLRRGTSGLGHLGWAVLATLCLVVLNGALIAVGLVTFRRDRLTVLLD